MARKTRTKKDKKIEELSEILECNAKAVTEGPRRKNFTSHDLKHIKPLNNAQTQMFELYLNGNNIIANGSAGSGKAQPLYSKVMTPDGWKRMGDLQISDNVVTPDGKIAQIIGIFPQGKKDIYEITFSDGSKTRACLEHLWECNVPQSVKYRRYSNKKIISTEQIIEILKTKSKDTNVSIDMISGIEYPEAQLPLDPYLLGVLIGDGCLRSPHTPSFTSIDEEIISNVSQLLREDYKLTKLKTSYNICQKNVKKDGKSPNFYTKILKDLGLNGSYSKDKFIPDIYKKGSINQRLKLIQGLLDTDGTVGKNTGGVSFSTSSEQLAEDLQDILWSIGAKCSITTKNPFYYDKEGNKKFGLLNYILHISYKNPKNLFKLTRKRNLCSQEYDPLQLRRRIKSVVYVGNEEAQCIMINDPKHLYITDDYIITHNTFCAMYLALNDLLNRNHGVNNIKIVRSAVSSREIGHLPGSISEKLEPYEAPYKDIFADLLGKFDAYEQMCAMGYVQFMPTSFVRGLTWDNSIVIIDEVQNMNFYEINSIITRIGENSKIIICGDYAQNDLHNKRYDSSGMGPFLKVARASGIFEEVIFTRDDIVRSKLVKQWICALEDMEQTEKIIPLRAA